MLSHIGTGKLPEVKSKFDTQRFDLARYDLAPNSPESPEEFSRRIKAEMEKYAKRPMMSGMAAAFFR